MELCPCGSEKKYQDCCQRYHQGELNAPTALETMRARYCAFVKHEIDYLKNTHDPNDLSNFNEDEIRSWSENATWLGLELLNSQEDEQSGTIEFIAKYQIDEENFNHHEISEFKKVDGRWYFMDGKIIRESVKRTAPKVGRNDSCPCGSGKKYKKCCMK